MNKKLEEIKKKSIRKISEEDVVNVWLEEFFNTSLEEIKGNYQKDEEGNFPSSETRKFYSDYAVTQEQHDWWLEEIDKLFKKKSSFKRPFSASLNYLNTSPQIKIDDLQDN